MKICKLRRLCFVALCIISTTSCIFNSEVDDQYKDSSHDFQPIIIFVLKMVAKHAWLLLNLVGKQLLWKVIVSQDLMNKVHSCIHGLSCRVRIHSGCLKEFVRDICITIGPYIEMLPKLSCRRTIYN